jgi:hypothetical protein
MEDAPALFKRKVTLTDVYQIEANLADSTTVFQLSANGFRPTNTATTWRVPQPGIWDQYAGMFEYYQVDGLHVEWLPYNYTFSGTPTKDAVNYPSFSIIDPEAANPVTVSNFYSYGNC